MALYCDNLAKLELYFPEFLPCIVLSQGKENSARNLEDKSEAMALFFIFKNVRAGDLIGMGQQLVPQLQLLLDILGEIAGPAAPPDSVSSPPSASLNPQPVSCNSTWKYNSSLTCLLHHPS